ncbi:MAG: FtsW/RodA/SpoVE family cell cycle protein [Firmicutes bacterium]|nr:FtsW/RodA/SpoVE family cell cycle protein [Bacillota bacterium]
MNLGESILTALTGYASFQEIWDGFLAYVPSLFTALVRIILPVLAIWLLVRTARSLFAGKNEPEIWAWLVMNGDMKVPVKHWENVIGRGSSSDILLTLPTVSRSHAALIRDAAGNWTLTDLAGKHSLRLNGKTVEGSVPARYGDVISVGGVEAVLTALSPEEAREQSDSRTKPGKLVSPVKSLFILCLFDLLLGTELALNTDHSQFPVIALCFVWLLALMFLVYLLFRGMRRRAYEIETLAFFLSSLGLAVAASAGAHAMVKQTVAVTIGVAGFLILGLLLRNLQWVKALRWPVAGLALSLLLLTFLFGETIYGARNWLRIGSVSLQASELVKVAFIFAGAATLDRLFARRNLYSFILYAAAIVGALALMGDFGSASIFFVGFLMIAFLRSGDLATIALSCAGAGLAGFLALTVKPYIANRFQAWRHVWEYAYSTGYQQTRTMVALASGGFLGLGAGKGWLHHVAAADTDLVFGLLSEELGLLIALSAVASLIIAALFAVKTAYNARSTYYVIAACATGAILVFQMMLNVCGSLDLLPLTGVTFPFVSNGGSSMISAWMMLAYLKAADTRQNASFAIPLPKFTRKAGRKNE